MRACSASWPTTPVIFGGLKRIAAGDAKSRLVAEALERRIAIYCPHTALDAAPGGMGDWLAAGIGKGAVEPIVQATALPAGEQCKVVVFVPAAQVDRLRQAMAAAGAGRIGDYSHCSFNLDGRGTFLGGASTHPTLGQRGVLETVPEVRLEMVASQRALPRIAQAIARTHPYEEPAWEVAPLAPKPRVGVGAGRLVELDEPISASALVSRVKKLCGLKQVRLAAGTEAKRGKAIQLVAVCPGAGGSLFENVAADAYVTGEMRHHDVLAKVESGAAVVLTDHTNTERGYLPRLRKRMADALGKGVEIAISKRDADPLVVV
jgi:putative NIF3 family GTP cyclohydrolase 1 type 2